MAKFRFNLEPVLEIRRRAEREQQRVVAELERERIDLQSQLSRISTQREDERRSWQRSLGSGSVAGASGPVRLDLIEVRSQANASLGREVEARRCAVKLQGIEQRLVLARRELIERTTQRRALDRLRERRQEEFATEQARREAATLDDLVTSMAAARGEHR